MIQRKHRFVLQKDEQAVYLLIDGYEYPIEPKVARELGEAMFKTAIDVMQIENKESK